MQMQISHELAEQYNKALPERIRSYLNQRCIPDEIIGKFKLGWNGSAITIPIYNIKKEVIFFKYRKDPEDQSDKAKYWYDAGSEAELYGWENIDEHFVILCEGELDRLALESKSIPAITSTGGAGTFKDEWIKDLEKIPNLYICYDRDEVGLNNAVKILDKLPQARFISLSGLPQEKKDITDFFILGKTITDFNKLIQEAKSHDETVFYSDCLGAPEIRFLHPSQDFIGNKAYFTIPAFEYKPQEKNQFKNLYYVISSDKKLLRLDDEVEFYSKYKLHIKQLPAIKNPESRWTKDLIKKFIFDGYVPLPKLVFQRIKEIYMKYAEMKEFEWYYILALWVIGTYFYSVFETYPYLAFDGIKGTGKSKATRITTRLSFNGILSVSISEATLFRDIESLRCTLGIDEAEALKDPEKGQMIRALLNTGYFKGAKVPRLEKTQKGIFLTRYYETYSPKIIANTRGLEDTLDSRTIKVTMLRAKGERGSILDTENSEHWDELRHESYCFALCYFKEIRDIYLYNPEVKIANNRHNDLWCPLLSIAKFIFNDDPDEFNAIKTFALEQIGLAQEDSLDDRRTAFLQAIRDLTRAGDKSCSSQEIKEAMTTYLDLDEMEYIKTSWIGYRIKEFKLNKNRQRLGKGYLYSLKKTDVDDVIERYLEPDHACQEKPTNPTKPTYPTLS